MFFIGLDLGTSGLKAMLINEKGKIIKQVKKGYTFDIPQKGYSEQQPSLWVEATKEAIKELSLGYEAEIKSLAIAGQMHGLVLLDKNDNVIRPCILWNDGRSEKEVIYLNSIIGEDTMLKETGNIAYPGFTLPKLLWVKNNEHSNYSKINKIMLPKDYIVYMLTGQFVSDYSDQSGTLFLDCKNKKYSKKMLDLAGISENHLPKLHDSYDIIGTLKKDFGLPSCKVIMGGGDNALAAIGTGVIEEGSAMLSLGTSGTLFIPHNQFTVASSGKLHSFVHASGEYHIMACILSASSNTQWWIENILKSNDYSSELNITLDDLGHNKVFFAPYTMGERSPFNDTNVRGAFLHISLNTTRKDMSQAVLEGVAFAFKDCLEIVKKHGININTIRVCGGGAKNIMMRHILANVLNINIASLEVEEGPSYGAALLGLFATTNKTSLSSFIDKIVKIKDVVTPDPSIVTLYEQKYQTFKAIYPAIKDIHLND